MKQTLEPSNGRGASQVPFRPVVIRPAPLRLEGLERRIRSDQRLAETLRTLPSFRRKLAHAVHLHDAAARRRFASQAELADYLSSVAAG
jgi:hypothetical protein